MSAAKKLRPCKECSAPNDTVGHYCAKCLDERVTALPLTFAQSTLACAIADLEKLPPVSAVFSALFRLRQVHDAITPRIRTPELGVVQFDGQFWAYPTHSSECFGPFATEEEAQGKLLKLAAGALDG